VLSRDGADQSGEEADGLGRFLGGKRDEVGLCQLDLLIQVIAGRLSLAGPAFRPDLRLDLVDRHPPNSTFPPRGAVPRMR
jgi:hypothetical protein